MARRQALSSLKPPLCKGGWRAVGATEGLSARTVDLLILQNDRINNPSVTVATLGDSSLYTREPFFGGAL